MRKKGFTLVELLVVIAIIGILVAIITPNAFKALERAKIARCEADLHAIKSGCLSYYTDTGLWPSNLDELMTSSVTGWDGPYLEKKPDRSPWGSYDITTTKPSGFYTTENFSVYISVSDVPLESARRIDIDLDGVEGNTSGAVQYATTATTTLYYGVAQQ